MITIKDIQGNTRYSTIEPVGTVGRFTLGQEDFITVPVSVEEPIYFKLGDYVDLAGQVDESLGGLFGKIYEVVDIPSPTFNTSNGGYDYSLRMDAYYIKWKHKIMRYSPETGGNETSFNLTASLDVHLGLFLDNLQALSYTYRGTAFNFDIDSTVENSAKLVTYESTNLLDVLNILAETWGCEWWITDSVIHFGRCESGTAVKIEIGKEATEMTRSESKGTYATRIYAFGSERNIPRNYRPVDEGVVVNGVVQKRLMLPEGTPYIDAYRYDTDGNRVYIGEEGYEDGMEMPKEEAIEDVVILDDVYPRTQCVVGSVGSYTSTVTNETTGGETTTTFYYVTDTSGLVFDESYILEGEELKMKFESGSLNGMEFGVTFRKAGTELDGTTLQSDVYEIVANEDYGRLLPDDVLKPVVGDKFILFNWDSTKIASMGLVDDAEDELKGKAEAYVKKSMVDDGTYNTILKSDWVYNDYANRTFEAGQRIELVNKSFFETSRISRVVGFEINLDIPYDAPVYTIGESTSYSRIGEIEEKVDTLTYKGQTYTGGGGVYLIKRNDSTAPSDSNVFSALRALNTFLRKDKADKTPHKLSSDTAFEVGEYVSGSSGAIVYKDAQTGQTIGELDKLYVRMKAYFETLEIINVNSVGGKQIISPAGSIKVVKVEENGLIEVPVLDNGGNPTYNEDGTPITEMVDNGIPEGVYRCYFLAEQDGEKIDNRFRVGDLGYTEMFNAKESVSNNISNHYYWGRVDAVSNIADENGYLYIDLSRTDCDTGSNAPVVGDVINHRGTEDNIVNGVNLNADRQNIIEFSSVDAFSPSITLYQGVGSGEYKYSLTGKDVVSYGVDKSTNKAFMNVYGDMYVGDRNNTSYMRYTQENGLEIKGKLAVGTRLGDGTTIEEAIENAGGEGTVKYSGPDAEAFSSDVHDVKAGVNAMKVITMEAFADDTASADEIENINSHIADIEELKTKMSATYTAFLGNELLDGTAKTNLELAYGDFAASINELTSSITYAVADGNITSAERAEVDGKYTAFNGKYTDMLASMNAADQHIQWKINGNVNSLQYLKDALHQSTSIDGGLIQTSALVLGYEDENGNRIVKSGTNGLCENDKTIASWWGGDMIDGILEPNNPNRAKGLIRMDGTGYFADGALWWDEFGKIHADPQSFIINENQLGDYVSLFQIIYKTDPNDINVVTDEIDYIIPQYLMSEVRTNYLRIGDATISWDNKAKMLKVDEGFYSEKAISVLGASTPSGSGTAGKSYLSELLDVSLSSPSAGQALVFNGGKWVNQDISANGGGLDESQLESYLTTHSYAKTSDIPTSLPASDVYAWAKAATKPSYSFSEILSKPTTLSGYGITDAYDKTYIDDLMAGLNAKYVTLDTVQTVTAVKNFINGLKIGNILLSYDTTNKALKLSSVDGATIGVYSTGWMSALGASTPSGSGTAGKSYLSELLDVSLSSPSAGQVLSYNGSKWINTIVETGGGVSSWNDLQDKPSWIGSTKPTYTWSEITSKPSWIGSAKPSYRMNEINDATYSNLTLGNVTRKVMVAANKVTSSGSQHGYISRVALGLNAPTGAFSSAMLSVGANDDGTSFTDYYFSPSGSITDSLGNTYAKTSDIPTSLPASDVYAWAKAATKPSYSFSEILSKPTTLSGYGITNAYTKSEVSSLVDDFLPLAGGTMTGAINVFKKAINWIGGKTEGAIRYGKIDTTSYWSFLQITSSYNHAISYGGLGNEIGFYGYYSALTANTFSWRFYADASTGFWELYQSSTSDAKLTCRNTNGGISLLASTNRGVYDYTNSKWLIGTNGTNAFLLHSKVGIGTLSPEEQLHVVGNIKVTGNIYATGGITAMSSDGSGGSDAVLKSNWLVQLEGQSGMLDRPVTANINATADTFASMRMLLSTESLETSTGRPSGNGYILHFNWDNTANFNTQLYIPNRTDDATRMIQVRSQNGSTSGAWGAWTEVFSALNYDTLDSRYATRAKIKTALNGVTASSSLSVVASKLKALLEAM